MQALQNRNHKQVESKWAQVWKDIGLDTVDINSAVKPFYNLMMFPYPSAQGLHVGNMYAFTGSDIYGRFKRMQGYDVFEPIGLDGFGIHSENYALKIGRHPAHLAQETEGRFYDQLTKIGAMFDWKRTIETYKPEYYRYTQWLFTELFKQGLVYRASAEVNWCPSCKTVVADEQVIDGLCERCGNKVIKKALEQWFIRITEYAEKLNKDLENLDWSSKVKIAQKNWIGKKQGATINYDVVNENDEKIDTISCFTTRPETNFGATFVALSLSHPFINQLNKLLSQERLAAISNYVKERKNLSVSFQEDVLKEKTGEWTGLFCLNPFTKQKMPLYVADYVVANVGTGAVVGVPAHDKRDYAFARKFSLPIIPVIQSNEKEVKNVTTEAEVYEGYDGQVINSDFLNGKNPTNAQAEMIQYILEHNLGQATNHYHLRDWTISRQRYWGPPIPMIFCKTCADLGKSWFNSKEAASKSFKTTKIQENQDQYAGWYPVAEAQLPVELPFIEDFKPGDDGVAPLKKHKEFYETNCPECGARAVRETDVSDTFLDSSWYFLRYPSINNTQSLNYNNQIERQTHSSTELVQNVSNSKYQTNEKAFDAEKTKKWLPVDMYTGGAEHAVLHLMYSRFVTMALQDAGFLDFDEPFQKFFAHGLVIKDGAKMSKSKGNVVNPDDYIEAYGADALRCYLMFMGPFSDGGDFRDSSMEGVSRWLNRVWKICAEVLQKEPEQSKTQATQKQLHRLIKKVTEDIEKRHYNTVISSMMEFTNAIQDKVIEPTKNDMLVFIKLLAPLAPFITEELYQIFSGREVMDSKQDSIHHQAWPSYDETNLVEDMIHIVIQVNGKVRDSMSMGVSEVSSQEVVEARAKLQKNVAKYLENVTIRKTIYIQGKVINFVVA